jgi:hypothetical protein
MRHMAKAPMLLWVVGTGVAGCLMTIDRTLLDADVTAPGVDAGSEREDGPSRADATGDGPDGMLVGSSSANPGTSCLDVVARGGDQGDGVYWILPLGSASPVEMRCDMTNDEGGWTLVENFPLGEQNMPPNWSTVHAAGAVFHDPAVAFKLADTAINAIRTTGFRVNARASVCQAGPCTFVHTLYFKPTCAFSGVATSPACSTAFLDHAFTQPTPSASAPDPCAWHGGLVDSTCTKKGGVVTNHDPAHRDAGIFVCVGDLNSGVISCVREGDARAGVQVWVR